MLTVASAVEQVVASSDFAVEGMQSGLLNLSAYADSITPEIESLTMKSVQKASVVVALARLAKRYRATLPALADFQLHNLVSRSGLSELCYPKTPGLQKTLAHLFEQQDVQSAPFFVSTMGLSEVSIITHDRLAQSISAALHEYQPTLYLPLLSSLTMQTNLETIDTPRQSYTVIKQLALRDITIVEYITSPTELTIILHSRDLKDSFVILHDRFFA